MKILKSFKPLSFLFPAAVITTVMTGCQVHHSQSCEQNRTEGCYEAGPRGAHTCDKNSDCHPGRACSIYGWCHEEKDLSPEIRMK